jgi:tellurite resistance protein
VTIVVRLTDAALARLRERLRHRGERPSVVMTKLSASATHALEVMQIVAEYGPLCEAMFLVMLADGRVKNVERDVLRGALRVLTDDRVRSTQIESMLDAAARNVAEDGFKVRLDETIQRLKGDPARAELTYVLAAAVAAADEKVVPEEQAVLDTLAEGLGLDEKRINELIADFAKQA